MNWRCDDEESPVYGVLVCKAQRRPTCVRVRPTSTCGDHVFETLDPATFVPPWDSQLTKLILNKLDRSLKVSHSPSGKRTEKRSLEMAPAVPPLNANIPSRVVHRIKFATLMRELPKLADEREPELEPEERRTQRDSLKTHAQTAALARKVDHLRRMEDKRYVERRFLHFL